MNIYVGNLAHALTDADLRAVFSNFGDVQSVRIIYDKTSGRSRGFGFVEMSDDNEAEAAMAALGETDLQGRKLRLGKAESKGAKPDPNGSDNKTEEFGDE